MNAPSGSGTSPAHPVETDTREEETTGTGEASDAPASPGPEGADRLGSRFETERTPRPPRKKRRWLRWTIGVAVTIVLVLIAGVTLLASGSSSNPGDPRNRSDAGTAALVVLLQDEGVDVRIVQSVEAPVVAPGSTVVMTGSWLETSGVADIVDQRPGRIVLYGYDQHSLSRAGFPVRTVSAGERFVESGCSLPQADGLGELHVPNLVYEPGTSSGRSPLQECFPSGSGATLLEYERSGVTVDLLAGGINNGAIGTDATGRIKANAALGMQLLGENSELTWWIPVPPPSQTDDGRADTPLGLVPGQTFLVLVALVVLVTIVALWRGRRLGPILTERLPVVVRASETVEGHGRLYHRLKAYERAAAHLRAGTIRRLARRFGSSDPENLAALVSDRTGVPVATVRGAFVGPLPQTEEGLLTLRSQLIYIEQEART